MNRPSFQFYPGAWMSDMGLRACSSAARGLWMDLMCLMHQGEPYGYLQLPRDDGTFVPDIDDIARMTGNRRSDVRRWMGELRAKNVPGIDEKGAWFSRKMVRDEEQRATWKGRKKKERDSSNTQETNDRARGHSRDNGVTRGGMSRPSSSSSSSSPVDLLSESQRSESEREASKPPPEPLAREDEQAQAPDPEFSQEPAFEAEMEVSPEELAEEICLELAEWGDIRMAPGEAFVRAIANLLMTGSAKPGAFHERGGFTGEEVLDAVRGFIVARHTDQWHREQERRGQPRTVMWALSDPVRFAQHVAIGQDRWDAWKYEEIRKRDRDRIADEQFGSREKPVVG